MKKRKIVKLKEYQNPKVQNTLSSDYRPPLLQNAVDREYEVLDSLVWERKIVLDVGCGDGRHGLRYAPGCTQYIGIDISEEMTEISRKNWDEAGLKNTVVWLGDASSIKLQPLSINRAMSLYFTPGNFRKNNFDVTNYDIGKDINKNRKFISVISNVYQALRPGGELILTIYKDSVRTREIQKEFYTRTGQHINSKDTDPFVSTEEGFWSLRWTEERLMSNLTECHIDIQQVEFVDLNEISWMVFINKT